MQDAVAKRVLKRLKDVRGERGVVERDTSRHKVR